MLKFNCSIFALILSPILLPAQTPKSTAGEATANTSRGGVITGRVTDSQGQPVMEERIRVNRLDRNGEAQPFYVGTEGDVDPKILKSIFSIKNRILVTENNPPITVTIDLREKVNE